MKTKYILIQFLEMKKGKTVRYDMFPELADFGLQMYGVRRNVDTYSREFRKIKEDKKELARFGIKLIEMKEGKRWGEWRVADADQ